MQGQMVNVAVEVDIAVVPRVLINAGGDGESRRGVWTPSSHFGGYVRKLASHMHICLNELATPLSTQDIFKVCYSEVRSMRHVES